jgi:hypothetical protein
MEQRYELSFFLGLLFGVIVSTLAHYSGLEPSGTDVLTITILGGVISFVVTLIIVSVAIALLFLIFLGGGDEGLTFLALLLIGIAGVLMLAPLYGPDWFLLPMQYQFGIGAGLLSGVMYPFIEDWLLNRGKS